MVAGAIHSLSSILSSLICNSLPSSVLIAGNSGVKKVQSALKELILFVLILLVTSWGCFLFIYRKEIEAHEVN